MKIPEELFKKWNDLRSHGDGKKIAEETGLTEMQVSAVFKTQECTDSVFEKVAAFFQGKEEKIKAFL